jgi:hypothetical protein
MPHQYYYEQKIPGSTVLAPSSLWNDHQPVKIQAYLILIFDRCLLIPKVIYKILNPKFVFIKEERFRLKRIVFMNIIYGLRTSLVIYSW